MTSTAAKQSRLVSLSPVYYGWIVWLVATIGISATSPGQSFTVSLFFDSFIAEFGLSRTAISSLYGLGTFIASTTLTYIGTRIDRHGNRFMGVVIASAFALALFGMSTISGPLPLLLGIIAIRGLGQGSLYLVNTTVIAEWFKRLRGRVLAMSMVSFALFQAVYVTWLQRTLATNDWRTVWVMLGAGVAIIVIPSIWLLMRDRPEDYGLQPDGAGVLDDASIAAEAAEDAAAYTLREAMTTPLFWVFIMGRLIPPAWGTGLILHQVSLFAALGYAAPAEVAAATYANMALISAGAAIAAGWLVDKLRPGWVMALQLGALAVAMMTATLMTAPWLLWVYALSFGITMGSGGVFDGAVWANLFGRKYQGSIRGFVSTGLVFGSAVGPVLFGISFDFFGGYEAVLWLGVALTAIAIPASLIVKPPRKPKRKQA